MERIMTLSYLTRQVSLVRKWFPSSETWGCNIKLGGCGGGAGAGAGLAFRQVGWRIRESRAGNMEEEEEEEAARVTTCLKLDLNHHVAPCPSTTILCLCVQESKASTTWRGRGIPPHPTAGYAPTTPQERCGDSSRLQTLSINTAWNIPRI